MPGRQRTRFPWFPVIKCEDCLRDLECLNFCPAGVFDWEPAAGKPVVARPYDCIPGCRNCVEHCKGKSISLPGKKQVAAALRKIRAEDQIAPPHGDSQRRGRMTSEKARAKIAGRNSKNPDDRSVITLPAGIRKPEK